MLKRFILLFSALIAFSSCHTKKDFSVTRYHEDGRSKPTVALIPVFDRSEAQIAWNLSEEFTFQLKKCFLKRKNFFLESTDQLNEKTAFLTENTNPFSNNFSWVKEVFDEEEFAIFTELIEHDIHPKKLKNNFLDKITPPWELSLTMRIRIFDLRSKTPQVILQELIHQNHLIPKPKDLLKKHPDTWKKITFGVTPLGLAHLQFSKEVAKRIEDYILLSKSR